MKRRSTKSKMKVLEVLKEKNRAMSHDMLEEEIIDFNRATLYRILNSFWEDGIVHRIMGLDGKQYFAICTNCAEGRHDHDHLHFQCTNCDKVECLDYRPKINLPMGYVFGNFNGLVSGVCIDCA